MHFNQKQAPGNFPLRTHENFKQVIEGLIGNRLVNSQQVLMVLSKFM